MSSANSPIEAAFELQRRSIEHGERLFEHGLEMQRDATETMLRNGFAAQQRAQEEAVEMSRKLFDAQVEAVQSAMDGDEFQSMVDRQFDEYGEERSAAWDEFETEFFEAMEELTERQRDLIAESVRTMLDAQDDVRHQAVEATERGQEVAQTAQERTERAARQTADTAERQVEAAGQQAQRATQQAGRAAQQTAATAEAIEEQLEDLDGLGPTYADRLREQGIQSVAELGQANADLVAEWTDSTTEQAEEWVETAGNWT